MIKRVFLSILAAICVSATMTATAAVSGNAQGDSKKANDVTGVWAGSWEGDSSGKFEMTIKKAADGKVSASMNAMPAEGNGFTTNFKAVEITGNMFKGSFDDSTDENTVIALEGTIDSAAIKGTWTVQSKQGEKMGGGTWQAKKK